MEQPANQPPPRLLKWRSIQTKLTLAISLILIPVVSLLSILAFRNAQTLLRDRIIEQVETVVTARQDRLNDVVTHDLEIARRLSTDASLRTLATASGQTQIDQEDAQIVLSEILTRHPEFEAILIRSPEGNPSASLTQQGEAIDKLVSPVRSRSTQGVGLFEAAGRFYIRSPILDRDREVGEVLLRLAGDRIASILRDYSGLGVSGEIILSRRDGEDVVFITAPRNASARTNQTRLRIQDYPRLPSVLTALQLTGPSITTDYRGVEVVVAYRSFPVTGWGLIAKIDTQEAFAPIQQLRTELVQVSILILLLFVLVAYVVSRSITDPLHRLHVGTEMIRKGEWDYQLGIRTGDEVEQLAGEFTRMAQELKALYEGLERKVRERTAELVAAKDEIEAEKTKAETILTSIGDGVFVTNHRGKIIFFNRAAEGFTGYTKSQAIGKDFSRIVGVRRNQKAPVSRERTPTWRALRIRTTQRSDRLLHTHKDGHLYPVAVVATPLILNDKVLGAISVFRDITREKEIDRMKTEFISVASHQLRTPLSAIKWFTEMLLSEDAGKLSQEQRSFLEQVYGSNERMIELVNALLNVSRIEQGRIAIEPTPTDLVVLVTEVLAELSPKIEKKKLRVGVSSHQQLPLISIDPKLVRQVYANLISNAVKYTPDGGEVNILVSKKGEEILSQVADTGYGIPQDQQSRVFTKFFRGDNILRVSAEGTGLGLYIVKSIVESSGGKIWFTSEEGKGTTFWFTLPLKGSKKRKGERSLEETRI